MAERTTRRRPSRWHLPFWWATLLVSAAVLLAYGCAYIPPTTFWPIAFFGMAYPFLLPILGFLLVWWLLFRTKRALVPIAVLLIGVSHHGDYLQLWPLQAPPADARGTPFSILSWNVRLFDLYNWTNNAHTRNEILDVIAFEDADILCLQEFFLSDDPAWFNTRDTLLARFRYGHIHDHYTAHTRHGHHFGIAILSTWPMVGRGVVDLPRAGNNACIWADVVVGHDTLRIYNAHLASIRFGDEDYRFIEGLDRDTDGGTLRRGGLRIMGLLRDAFIRRIDQVERIAAHMRASPHPVVFGGDLNDTPMSYSHALLTRHLRDAFVESGSGVGHTYVGAFPSFRIDHLLHDRRIASWSFRTLPDELSDHRPITCRMVSR